MRTALIFLMLISIAFACKQEKKERPSPLREETSEFNGGHLKIVYSSPAVTNPEGENRQGKIWGDLVPYDSIWRTGANDATYLQTDMEVTILGKKIEPGSYALFTIPGRDQWEIILNKEWNQWGAYNYDSTLDAARFMVNARSTDEFSERMKFYFQEDSLKFHWENLKFSLPLE